jgi:hypothetical protein
MLITKSEVISGSFRINRGSIKGFEYKKIDGNSGTFNVFVDCRDANNKYMEISLGTVFNSWPGSTSAAEGESILFHLVYEDYRLLPEHILAISEEEKGCKTITVWTALIKFEINREMPTGITEAKKHEDFRNTLADEWIKAFELHIRSPFSV